MTVLVPLALTQTPSHDDFYTLEYARQPTLTAVIELHATSRNSTAVMAYGLFWTWGRVVGTSFGALGVLSIGAWVAMTSAIARLLRGLSPPAVLVGSLAPTLSSLAYLGFAARSYAVALALLAWMTVAAERALRPGAGRASMLLAAASAFGACLLSHPNALYVVFVAVGTLIGRHRLRAGWRLPAALSLAAALATIPQLGQAAAASAYGADLGQAGTSWWSGALTQPSLARTWWPLLAVLAASAARAAMSGRTGGGGSVGSGRWPSTGFCLVSAVALPVLAALPFAATGAAFHHRYAAAALIPSSLLLGRATDAARRSSRAATKLLAPAVLCSLALSAHAMAGLAPSRHEAVAFEAGLGLELSAERSVYVSDQRAFLVLRELGPRDRTWVLTTGQPTPIGRDQRGTVPPSGRRVVISATGPGWDRLRATTPHVRVLGRASLSYSGKTVHYVAAELT